MKCNTLIDGFSITIPDGLSAADPYYMQSTEVLDYVLEQVLCHDSYNKADKPKPARGVFFRDRYIFYHANGRKLVEVGVRPTSNKAGKCTSISVTGFACSTKAGDYRIDPLELISKCIRLAGHLTRIDIALDVFDVPDLFGNIEQASKKDVHKERIRTILAYEKPVPVGERETIYYGRRRQNRNSVAVYDKAVQQDVPGAWVRVEFRAGSRSVLDKIGAEIEDSKPISALLKALLNTYLTFLAPSHKSKQNRPIAGWWQAIVGKAEKYEFIATTAPKADQDDRAGREISIENLKSYINKFMAGSAAKTAEGQAALQELMQQFASVTDAGN